MSEEKNVKSNKGKRFLLGLLYFLLLIAVVGIVYLTESPLVGLILSIILLVGYIIYPKRKGLWFWWWVVLAAVWCGWYGWLLTKM